MTTTLIQQPTTKIQETPLANQTLQHSNGRSPSNIPTDKVSQPVKTLSLSFDLPIFTRELPQWRGAFIEMAGWENPYFHNHRPESEQGERGKYYYRYPLIQYRVHKGKAALFAINEGVQALQQVLASSDWQVNWNGQATALQVEDLRMNQSKIQMTEQLQTYQLYKWFALNQQNYQLWQQCSGLVERTQLLERILRGHLLSCLWGLGWEQKDRIKVTIQEIRKSQMIPFKGAKHLMFDVVYTTQIQLPSHLAIGKATSLGFGWQVQAKR